MTMLHIKTGKITKIHVYRFHDCDRLKKKISNGKLFNFKEESD